MNVLKTIGMLLLCCFFYIVSADGQVAVVSGIVHDSTGSQQMKGASVVLLREVDSAFVRFTPVQPDASFKLANVPYGNYLLQMSFMGFETRYLHIHPDRPEVNLDTIYLLPQVYNLGDIVVRQPPVVIRNDTVEFNAGSFPTRAYAVLEELLKKLPGVQVGPGGNIKVNGVTVERLLVDGVPFFGGNTQIAARNLPADIVDKVQVYDASSDQKAFNGFDNGVKQKTVNVVIKKNKRKGYFGNVMAGAGTDRTYATGLNLNRFNGNQQLSMVAQANNINTQSQSVTPSASPTVSPGINRLGSIDLNYRDKWGSKTLAYGNYSFSHQRTTYEQDSRTQNIFQGDSMTFNNQASNNVRTGDRHRINFNIDARPDSFNTIIIRPNASYSRSSTNDSRQTLLTDKNGTDSIYRSDNRQVVSTEQQSAGGSLAYMHRFRKPSRTFSLDVSVNSSQTRNESNSNTSTTFLSEIPVETRLDQRSVMEVTNSTINPVVSYTEPLGRNQAMEVNYKFRYNLSDANSQVFRLNDDSHLYDQPDSLQSNHFKNLYQTHQLMLNYRLNNKGWHVVAGIGVEDDKLKGNNITQDTLLRARYFSVTPSVNATWGLSDMQKLQFSYNGMPQALSVEQLQPVQSTTDSLFIRKGNPSLIQPYMHNASLTYSLTFKTQRMLSIMVNMGSVRNAVQYAIYQLPSGAQVSTPVNLNGTYNISSSIGYSSPLKSLKSSINLLTSFNYQHSPVILNGETSNTKTSGFGESITLQGQISEQFDYYISAVTNFFRVHYDQVSISYLTEQLNANARYYYNAWVFNMALYYIYNNSLAPGFKRGIPLLSPAISRQLFKNRAGELKLSVNDLLQQNLSVSRITTANTIKDTRTSVRQRYVMLSFTYNFRSFKGR